MNTMELPRSTSKVGTQQFRGVVGLPMMVLALVMIKAAATTMKDSATKSTTTMMVGLTVVKCVERGLQCYSFQFD